MYTLWSGEDHILKHCDHECIDNSFLLEFVNNIGPICREEARDVISAVL